MYQESSTRTKTLTTVGYYQPSMSWPRWSLATNVHGDAKRSPVTRMLPRGRGKVSDHVELTKVKGRKPDLLDGPEDKHPILRCGNAPVVIIQ